MLGRCVKGWYLPLDNTDPLLHDGRMSKIKHGLHVSAKKLGIPDRYEGLYQEFLDDGKPFDLRKEIALLRLLYVRMEEALTATGQQKIVAIEEAISSKLMKVYGEKTKDAEKLQKTVSTLTSIATAVIAEELGVASLGLGLEDLADHLEKITRAAERMKKIQEGVKLQVNIDTSILVRFIQDVVFHFVEDGRTRQQIIERAMKMSVPNSDGPRAALAAPRVEVTADNVDPLGAEFREVRQQVSQPMPSLEDML